MGENFFYNCRPIHFLIGQGHAGGMIDQDCNNGNIPLFVDETQDGLK